MTVQKCFNSGMRSSGKEFSGLDYSQMKSNPLKNLNKDKPESLDEKTPTEQPARSQTPVPINDMGSLGLSAQKPIDHKRMEKVNHGFFLH